MRLPAFSLGFSLIELMVVIAIISLLVALGVPAYQDYTTRTKISEAFTLSTAAKVSMAEFYQSMGFWPEDNKQAGLAMPHELKGNYVSGIEVKHNKLIVTFNDQIVSSIKGKSLFFTGIDDAIGQIRWHCDAQEIDSKYLPSNCREKG